MPSPMHLPRVGEMPALPDQPVQWAIPARWLGVAVVVYGGTYWMYRVGRWLVGLALP